MDPNDEEFKRGEGARGVGFGAAARTDAGSAGDPSLPRAATRAGIGYATARNAMGRGEEALFSFDFGALNQFDLPSRKARPGKKARRGRRSERQAWRQARKAGAGEEEKGQVAAAEPRAGPGAEAKAEAKAEPETEEERILSTLRTGEDVISFFALHGTESPVKFVHLNRAPEGLRFRPYDLVVCSRGEVDPEHFTMSAAGVVRVAPGEPSEFVPLSEWMRQATMFNVISNIGFFKNYLVSKMFHRWRSSVRYLLFRQQRQRLRSRLFLAKESFCSPLLAMNRSMSELHGVQLLDVQSSKTYEVATFQENQDKRRAEALSDMQLVVERVHATVNRVCKDAAQRAQRPEGGQPVADVSAGGKAKSMVAVKQEQAEYLRSLRQADEEAAMLGDLIRLVDYMTVEHLSRHVKDAALSLLGELRAPRKQGLFVTTVSFGEDITFDPEEEAMRSATRRALEKLVDDVNGGVPRLVTAPPFKDIVADSGLATTGPDMVDQVRGSAEMRTVLRDAQDKVASDFADARAAAESFREMWPVWEYVESFDADAYGKQQHTVQSIKGDMARLARWEADLERMKVVHTCGVVYVEGRRLKTILQPRVGQVMNQMKALLTDLAARQCQQMVEEYTQRIDVLVQQPQHLKEFAGHVERLQGIEGMHEDLQRDTNTVDEMYRVLKGAKVQVSPEDDVRLDDLRALVQDYQDKRDKAEYFVEDRLPEMTQTLDMNIARLNDQLSQLTSHLQQGAFTDAKRDPSEVVSELDAASARLDSLAELADTYARYQKLFNIAEYEFRALEECRDMYAATRKLWTTLQEWEGKLEEWYDSDFREVDAEELAKAVQGFYKDAFQLNKRFGNEVSERLLESVNHFRGRVNVVVDLGNPHMKDRHWLRLFKALGQDYAPGQAFTLRQLDAWDVWGAAETVGEVSGIASGEAGLERDLEKVAHAWEEMEFTVLGHRESTEVFILGGLDDVFTQLEDDQVSLQTMMGSRFISGVQEQVEQWDRKLSLLSDTLDEWVTCQRNWMYLETIFSADDIQKQLPAESTKFMTVDKNWRNTMKRTAETPGVLAAVEEGSDLLDMFRECNQLLEEIQKSLEEYLETKRAAFPRFYFLSNDELLEILSQTRDPRAVQPHLGKCFDAIKSIEFGEEEGSTEVKGMTSGGVAEYVPFSDVLQARGPVESWLLGVEKMMRQSLYDRTKLAVEQYPEREAAVDRSSWLFSAPAQCIIVVDQVMWTANATAAIQAVQGGEDPKALEGFLKYSLEQIDNMVALVRGDLTANQRTLMGALTVIDVHARDVVKSMIAKGVTSVYDFEWTRQLRYYWDDAIDNCVARQTNTRFVYGYEYLGNGPRLVITPLTDICYMTLTGALHLRFGGAPAGPAGTGKTETVKDLAKALATQCVVFNCSDGLDFKIMGRFFSGLAQAGAWACFDEFNRIDIEVLSVIAQQILCIQQAIVNDMVEFDFEGHMIPLNKGFGVFITMNPGYAGRTELPDNLKALFRPVAMMVPDYRLIAEIILFSEGFSHALPLSNKMVQLYKLSSEQLSKQDHYDFGMRAVKSVLVAAGSLKRKEPETDEDLLLIRAMRDSNVPKFLEKDLVLFRGILTDLFPGVKVPFVDYGALQTAIETQLRRASLQVVPSFVSKIIQVHETQLVRHGMMVVGEAGSGKTANVATLARALTQLHGDGVQDRDGFYKEVVTYKLNPKSITAGQLYGEFNELTSEWTDGLVPKLVRQTVADTKDRRQWIMFDGPVDAVWIENMNTVLDDNKTLCLANSERIKLPGSLHMMFEVQDLAVASPATVSRCGMVFMEQIHIGLEALVDSWAEGAIAERLPQERVQELVALVKRWVPPAVAFVRDKCSEKVPTTDQNLMASCLNLLASLLHGDNGVDQSHPVLGQLQEQCFLFALVWSVGGNLADDSRDKFNEWVLQGPADVAEGAGELGTNVYGARVGTAAAEWAPWSQDLEDFVYNPKQPYFNILVPTVDTTRTQFLLRQLLLKGQHVLVMGETGVGKSVVVQQFLDAMAETEGYVSATVNYSAQTKPANLKDIFETKLEKKRKTLLGAPAGKRMLMFVDDLNMPALEVYGAQPPNELLRQTIDQGGFYDTEKKVFKQVADVYFAAACAPPGGGRNEVTPRLMRHFHMLWMVDLGEESMCRIFRAILGGFLGHALPDLVEAAGPIVEASVRVYLRVQAELLPTPARSHYTFNLRDLSKVFQGVLDANRDNTGSREELVTLWLHEEARVFRDRLINVGDRTWFNDRCAEELQSCMGLEWGPDQFADVLYGDFLAQDKRVYKRIDDRADKLQGALSEYLEEYNLSFTSQMHLVFFRDAIAHVCRIVRVLRQPRGNALLVGVGGSGRQSLTRLAAFVRDFKVKSIEITRGYGVEEWHEDLKAALKMAGADNTPSVFLFSDTQIVKESFLEDINNILNSGEVPNLYEPEDLEEIVGKVRPLAAAAGKLETRDAALQHYVQLVRENLHVVLCFSPIGSAFRRRLRMFPSIINCCTVDWFNAWPEDALYSVAHRFLAEQTELGIEEYVDPLCKMAVRIHRGVEDATARFERELHRHNYTTPTSYLELIRLYLDMLGKQRDVVAGNEGRYRGGLKKLEETEEVVAGLQEELTVMQPKLIKAQEDTAALMEQLAEDQKKADAAREVAQKDEASAQGVADEVKALKDDCQKDLDEALPAYHKAIKALDSLDKKSIQEVKSFANPPALVATTLEAVCILMGSKPVWAEAKKLMNDMAFLDKLRDYDKDNIAPAKIRKLKKYIDNPEFTPDNMKSVSTAATSLCMWVRAMWVYDKVAKNIVPKKEALAKAEERLDGVMTELKGKQAALKEVEDKVAELQAQYDASVRKKEDLERQAEKTKVQLDRAEKLIGGLASEKVRWTAAADQLNADLTNLVGDVMLAAGMIAYAGPFTAEYRHELAAAWVEACRELHVPVDAAFSLQRTLADPVEVRQWTMMGLPADDFSVENGMLATQGRRWPLMIDPQGQANRWVKNLHKGQNLQVIKLSDKDFLRTLENAIRYGAPVLLENVQEELDPSLEPVLLKQVFKKGGQWLLRLGDSDVPYSSDFKFYITTKLANPHYLPEVCVKVTVINFTVTLKGLEDQLLVDVVRNERPDLEERKDKLVVSIAADKKELKEIEDKILSMLANSSGNILDDEELIDNLAASKKTSEAIAERMREAEKTTAEIGEAREGYRTVATRGSIIYFVLASLSRVDPMYQYSLQFFQKLYNLRIQRSEAADDLATRLDILLRDITYNMYLNVCRGLFDKDKLLFSFIIAVEILRNAGRISGNEWKALLVGPAPAAAALTGEPPAGEAPGGGGRPADPPAALSGWLPKPAWQDACALEAMPPFAGLASHFEEAPEAWQRYVEAEEPQQEALPAPWDERLTAFQTMLVLRALRPEKVVFATRTFVGETLGPKFMESPPFDLEGCYEDSTCETPLIFVLSPGADINDYLLSLAKSRGKDGSGLKIISLGQGQGPIAEKLMEGARRDGDWVCLQNCHLAVSWLPRLEQILEQAAGSDVHPEYRLWLTSMPSDKFPVPILQNGIKITNEPPRGLRANLGRTFADMTEEDYEGCTKPREWKKLLFGLAFYNAIALERRKFGAIGWNIPYEWMNSDLKTAIMQLKLYLEEQDEVPYETLNVMVGDITYGGRITDAWDKRTNRSILLRYFTPRVMDDSYRFSESSLYYAPPEGDLASLRAYIESLPMNDTPEVFGLHANADITFQQKESHTLLNTVIQMQGGGGGGGGSGDSEQEAQVLEICSRVEDRMPALFDERDAHPATFDKIEDGSVNSMGVVCAQEMIRFNKLMQVISKSLVTLRKAIKGLVVMSGQLEDMYNAFLFQRVPAEWEAAAYPCLKPLASWVDDFFRRLDFIGGWLREGPPPVYWVSGFFFPQGFMTGVLQTHSRKTRIAIDTLTFQTKMTSMDVEDVAAEPETGVYIHGLFMQGARFDRRKLKMAESLPGQLFDAIPIIWLQPVELKDYHPKGVYNCPLYKTSRRAGTLSTTGHSTNFVVSLDVPSSEEEAHWVRRGVALLCMLDD